MKNNLHDPLTRHSMLQFATGGLAGAVYDAGNVMADATATEERAT